MELKSHWEKMKKIPICVFASILYWQFRSKE